MADGGQEALFGASEDVEPAHHFGAVLLADGDAACPDAEHMADKGVDVLHIHDVRAVDAQKAGTGEFRGDLGQGVGEGQLPPAVEVERAVAALRLDVEDGNEVDSAEKLFVFDEDGLGACRVFANDRGGMGGDCGMTLLVR